MKVIKMSEVKAEESANPIFKGKTAIQQIVPGGKADLRVAVVNFSPGAVNVFHTHTYTQIIYVTEGKGIVATESEEVTVGPGTWVVFPAGEKHWHGATKNSKFSHIAISPPGETSF